MNTIVADKCSHYFEGVTSSKIEGLEETILDASSRIERLKETILDASQNLSATETYADDLKELIKKSEAEKEVIEGLRYARTLHQTVIRLIDDIVELESGAVSAPPRMMYSLYLDELQHIGKNWGYELVPLDSTAVLRKIPETLSNKKKK